MIKACEKICSCLAGLLKLIKYLCCCYCCCAGGCCERNNAPVVPIAQTNPNPPVNIQVQPVQPNTVGRNAQNQHVEPTHAASQSNIKPKKTLPPRDGTVTGSEKTVQVIIQISIPTNAKAELKRDTEEFIEAEPRRQARHHSFDNVDDHVADNGRISPSSKLMKNSPSSMFAKGKSLNSFRRKQEEEFARRKQEEEFAWTLDHPTEGGPLESRQLEGQMEGGPLETGQLEGQVAKPVLHMGAVNISKSPTILMMMQKDNSERQAKRNQQKQAERQTKDTRSSDTHSLT